MEMKQTVRELRHIKMSNEPKILILGSGPAAAYTYRACRDLNITPRVLSNADPARARGAFWLSWLPPSLAERMIHTWKIFIFGSGSPETYMRKQWGDEFAHYPSSFPLKSHHVSVFDPNEAIRMLWNGVKIEPCEVLGDSDVQTLAEKHDLVIQTFATDQARKRQWPPDKAPDKVWVMSTPSERVESAGVCIYSGQTFFPWVRYTDAFGELNIEFAWEEDARRFSDHYQRVSIGYLPTVHWYPNLRPDTEPFDLASTPNILLTGRFARWDRAELSHHSYQRVRLELLQRFGETS